MKKLKLRYGLITIHDVRRAKMCCNGCREFCKRNNICWSKFITQGLPMDFLASFDDAMVNDVIKYHRRKYGRK